MRRFGHLLLLLFLLRPAIILRAEDGFYLRPGDRVVFHGDSAPDQRLFSAFVETYVSTRFPRLNISFFHSGWKLPAAGDAEAAALERDVLSYKPTVLVLLVGFAEEMFQGKEPAAFESAVNSYRQIIEATRAAIPALRVVVLHVLPLDRPLVLRNVGALQSSYTNFIRQIVTAEDVTDVDLGAPLGLPQTRTAGSQAATGILPSLLHPDPAGHLAMAQALLKAWHAPATVSWVEVDSLGHSVPRAEGAIVRALDCQRFVSWSEDDQGLPLPLPLTDRSMRLDGGASDLVQELDQQYLRVSGLIADQYRLTVDGQPVGTFPKATLNEGINMALLPTPMVRQAARVHAIVLRHHQIHLARCRLQLAARREEPARWKSEIDTLAAEEQKILEDLRAAAEPKTHDFELQPIE